MEKPNRITKWSVIIGIVIVLNLFFNYTLGLVYEEPEYDAFCPTEQVVRVPESEEACLSEGGQWTENSYFGKPSINGAIEPRGYCDLHFTCRQEFQDSFSDYNRTVFVALVVLGALSVLVGSFFKSNEVIGNGLSLAGVLSFVIASMRYWSSADDIIRVVILAIALALLFWIAIKKFNDRVRSETNRT